MHGPGRLGVAEFTEQCSNGGVFLSIDIGGADFGFGGRSHDVEHNFGHGVHRSIEPRASSGRLCRIE